MHNQYRTVRGWNLSGGLGLGIEMGVGGLGGAAGGPFDELGAAPHPHPTVPELKEGERGKAVGPFDKLRAGPSTSSARPLTPTLSPGYRGEGEYNWGRVSLRAD
ncbi:MAG: hypothetical protein ABSF29_15350 [Tepidisphaeraceae bacterium]